MKTIIFTIENGFQARDFLRSDFYELIKKNQSLRAVILVPKEKFDLYSQRYASNNVVFEPLPEFKKKSRLEIILFELGKRSIPATSIRLKNLSFIYKKKYFTFFWRQLIWLVSQLKLWRRFIRYLYNLLPNVKSYYQLFDKYQPDLVCAFNLLRYDEFRLVAEAKNRGIKTLSLILSWDNLTTKLFLFNQTEKFLVPNNIVKEEAIRYGEVAAGAVKVYGYTKFDGYFKGEGLLSRADFFKQIGADFNKKLIVFACVSQVVRLDYFYIFNELATIIKSKITPPFQVLVRLYPKYVFSKEELQKIKDLGFLISQPSRQLTEESDDWEIDEADDLFLKNMLKHCDLLISAYSTLVLEAAIFNKPIININFDGQHNFPFPLSVRRYRRYNHFYHIVKTGGERPANNLEELKELIGEYLTHPEKDATGRQQIVKEQCQFIDGRSGERMYKYILEELE